MRVAVFCIFFVGVGTLFLSCRFNPEKRDAGTAYLQGIWQEGDVAYQDQLLTYTRHRFVFTCDSVYIKLVTTAKVNHFADTCFNNGKWAEYAKGTYTMRHDSLFVDATFTHDNYKQKLSGCYRIGKFMPVFKVIDYSSDSLQLNYIQKQVGLKLTLEQSLTCTPNP